jgi:lysine-specific demethylase 8
MPRRLEILATNDDDAFGVALSPPLGPEVEPPPRSLSLRPVRRMRRPSLTTLERYARAGEPLIIHGAIDAWRALGRWTPELLRERAGSLRTKAYVIPDGHVRLDSKTGFVFEEITLGSYVEQVVSGGPPKVYFRAPVDSLPRDLREDLGVPDYCRGRRRLRHNLWLSAPGTVSRLHFDLPHNLIAQIHGRKRFYLYPAKERNNLYPFPPWSSVPHLSRVDLEAPDLVAFPRLARARGYYADTREGDLLFMPSRMWHHVRSLGASITVNFWWPPLAMLPFVLASDAYKRLRGLNI